MSRQAIHHRVKCHPEPFDKVRRGEKTFEIRVNDRDYREGDLYTNERFDPTRSAYTGETDGPYTIGTVIPGGAWGLPENVCVFSLLPAAAPTVHVKGSEAARDVLAERARQKAVEGWTEAHDDKHGSGELAKAAGCYALVAGMNDGMRASVSGIYSVVNNETLRNWWPWSYKWWKCKERRRDLVRAGALILAEIERLDRAAVAGRAA